MKAILPLLPLLLAGAAFGADGAIAPGFQLGLGWVMPDDARFTGTTVDFYLFLAPEATVDLGYLREEMFLTGRDGGETVTERGHYDAMRVRFRLYDDEIQSARLLADAGYAWFSLNHPVGAWAFDLGAEYVPWKIASGAVKTEVAIQLRYRYCRFHPIETFGDAGRPVDDAGGFMAGIAGDVRF